MTDFEQYARSHTTRLLRVAYLLCGSKEEAEDLTQEALVKIHKEWRRVSRAESSDAYARRVLVNHFLSERRRRQVSIVPLSEAVERAPAGQDFSEAIADKAAVRQAMRHLPERQRLALVLRYFEHATDEEIAQLMQIQESTVRSTIARALNQLQTQLTHQENVHEQR